MIRFLLLGLSLWVISAHANKKPCVLRIEQLAACSAVYPLKQPIEVELVGGTLKLPPVLASLGLELPKKVKGPEQALYEVSHALHRAYQRVCWIVPGERTADERNLWSNLVSIVDVEGHKYLTPLRVRKGGTIVSVHPLQILWLNDEVPETIEGDVPHDFARYPKGSYVSTIVEFRRGDEKTLRILYAEADIDPLEQLFGVRSPNFARHLAGGRGSVAHRKMP